MLIRFRVQNFLSFKEQVEFSMVAGKVQKHSSQVIKKSRQTGVDLLKLALVYGANASGKSNLVKAIDFGKNMVTNGLKAKALIPRKPFKLDPQYSKKPSLFEYEFQFKERVYVYGFKLDAKRILEEWLIEIKSTTEKTIFRRTFTTKGDFEVVHNIKADKIDLDLFTLVSRGTPQNKLLLSECEDRNVTFFNDVYEWFDDALVVIYPGSFHNLAPIAISNENKFGKILVDYLNKFSTGVCGYSLEQVKNENVDLPKEIIDDIDQQITDEDEDGYSILTTDNKRYFFTKKYEQLVIQKLLLKHHNQTCNSDVFFEMDEESDGTSRLLDLIPILIPQKGDRNSVIIIDELDRSLHPSLSNEFLTSFLESNLKRQLIVTTHESTLLDLDFVRRDEIWFVEKDQTGSSSLYSLEEFTPRYDNDIRKGYLLGRFGAIPVMGEAKFLGE